MSDHRGVQRPEPGTETQRTARESIGRETTGPNTLETWLAGSAGASPAAPATTKPAEIAPPTTKSGWRKSRVGRIVVWGVAILAVLAAVPLILIVAYLRFDPPTTTTILIQRAAGQQITQRWVPLDRISPNLVRAVIMSEDAGFCRHRGVDWRELETAIESARDGIVRGGSTIPMQVTKNLFLWPSRSYVRKAIEIPLTLVADAVWGKARMMEIYLNVAEWGPGIFGAEAAAQYHFRKPASRLTEAEAALLAVTLPAPIARDAGDPGQLQTRMAQTIQGRMRSATTHTRCVLPAG